MPELERTFDVNGETLSESVIEDTPTPQEAAPQLEPGTQDLEASPEGQDEGTETEAQPAGKIRIGDQVFEKQADALAYAQKLEQDRILADAYSKGLLDAQRAVAPPAQVTPAVPEPEKFDEEKFYGNPQQFLKEYGEKIVNRTLGTVEEQARLKQQNEKLWNEFSSRHPDLAEFRTDVESLAEQNSAPLQAVVAVKGLTGGYDYLATKLKEKFTRQAEAIKPKKALPNTGGGASPAGSPPSVTPKKAPARELTFAEQLRLHRSGKR